MAKLSLLFFIVFFTVLPVFSQTKSPIQLIREDLFYSEFDLTKCFEFDKSIDAIKDKSPLIQAYKAASTALLAKYSWNPVTKFNYLNDSKKLLDKAVIDDAQNLEIRFLRLYIQKSLPDYLGMSKNVSEDKKIIIDNLDKLEEMNLGKDIMDYIVNYISSPKVSSNEEIKVIKAKMTTPAP